MKLRDLHGQWRGVLRGQGPAWGARRASRCLSPPVFESDEAAERFVDTADLTEYDLSQFKPVRFEFARKDARVNMRLPEPLLAAVKARARARGIPYQRFIRKALEEAVIRR